jgi:hypothetical protein
MKIEVINKSVAGLKKHIAIGFIPLRTGMPRNGVETTFVIDLIHRSKNGKKDIMQGVATIRGQIIDTRPFDICGCQIQ